MNIIFEVGLKLINKNKKLCEEVVKANPETFNKLRKMGYDVIEEYGDRYLFIQIH